MQHANHHDYRLAPHVTARLVGLGLALVGVLVLLLTVAVAVLRLPVATIAVVALVAVVGVTGLGFWATRRAYVLRLSDEGYVMRLVRGAGTTRARWSDVEDMATTTVNGDPCLVLRLEDGRSTTIPVQMLAGDREDLVRELQQRLTKGHGIRPLR